MDRKDIYEHLAKIYLDASSKTKRKKRRKDYSWVIRGLFVAGIVALLSVMSVFLVHLRNNKLLGSKIALVFAQEAVRMNFNFSPAKKESYTLNLNNLNFKPFRTLAFSVRKAEAQRNISLKIGLANSSRETSEMYVRNIPNSWQHYRINLSDFKGISNWSKISELSFVIEEWKVSSKKGVVYINNVRLLK